ncbi:MAG: hypothetical protein F6K42_34045 [Leptolyngbya sp. SIO1D8]|nr:hypothetical protein [Leptolyngbya sp. SIO1D8]
MFPTAFLLMLTLAGQAGAQSNEPRIGGNAIFRLGYNGVYDAQSPKVESNDILGIMIASPELHLTRQFSFQSEIRFEDIRPPADDRVFEDEGLFVRKLFANYKASDRLSFQVGKFTPSFSFASLVTPGMFGNNYNKEIELIERIGFGAEYVFDAWGAGKHKLSAATFFDDTSLLSDSLGSSRGPKELSDGGASNTESFESIAIALEVRDVDVLSGLSYKFGFLHQEHGDGGVADENGILFAAARSHDLGGDRSLTWIGEFAPLWNFDGTDDDISYTSAGLVYEFGHWTTVLSGTYRRRDLARGGAFNDYSVQTSLDYDIGHGLSFAVAHEFLRDQNVESRRIGIRLSAVIDLDRN